MACGGQDVVFLRIWLSSSTKAKLDVKDFKELKKQVSQDINNVIQMDEIPSDFCDKF